MEINLADRFQRIQADIEQATLNEFIFSQEDRTQHAEKIKKIIETHIQGLEAFAAQRVRNEYYAWGPLTDLLADETITEIMVNGRQSLWLEREGRLQQHTDSFWSEITFRNILEKMCTQAGVHISLEHPCADGAFGDFRLSVVGNEITKNGLHLTLRRHPKIPWTFEKLSAADWCPLAQLEVFREIISKKKNFLIVGATGSGKTSVLNSFLNLLPPTERLLAIEDTSEITLPNSSCLKLLTREDPYGLLPVIDQTQLVKRALRLRPDRIVMGEIRGAEAKDFLMALATGHVGSFGTLHAKDAHQALIRLEMLIQMGAPQWSLQAVRRLIQLSLDCIVITEKNERGERKCKGVYQITSLEDHGFLLERVD